MKKPSLMARFTTSTAMQRDTLRTSDSGGYSRPFFNCSSSTKFARARTLATTMPLVTCLAPANDAPRPSPGKMYLHCTTDQQTRNKGERGRTDMLLPWPGTNTRPSSSVTGSNGEPLAKIALPSVALYACCDICFSNNIRNASHSCVPRQCIQRLPLDLTKRK